MNFNGYKTWYVVLFLLGIIAGLIRAVYDNALTIKDLHGSNMYILSSVDRNVSSLHERLTVFSDVYSYYNKNEKENKK